MGRSGRRNWGEGGKVAINNKEKILELKRKYISKIKPEINARAKYERKTKFVEKVPEVNENNGNV